MDNYKRLLEKFWAGEATELEKWQLYKLVTEMEKDVRIGQETGLPFADGGVVPDPMDSKRILESLHEAIDRTEPRQLVPERRRIGKWVRSLTAAAAILITVFLIARWAFHSSAKIKEREDGQVKEHTIANHDSHILAIRLEDSSQVNIYPGSSISYQEGLNRSVERIIRLAGKAGFTVHHNASAPFRVITGQIVTTDIGTVFRIDATDTNFIKVSLQEGSVKVEALPAGKLVINRTLQHPGEELCINMTTREIQLNAAPENTLARKNQASRVNKERPLKPALRFNRTPLAEVFAGLAQREQVKINFVNKDLEGLTFTGSIEPKDSLELSLNIICSLNGLSYTKTGQGITITKSR